MGHSQAEKAESHKKIVKIASKKVREDGLDALSVAALMKAAGLTHGGFYGHFPSRDAMVAEALETALATGSRDATPGGAKASSLREWLRVYLSRSHRDNPGTGCALAALAGDLGRSSKRERSIYTRFLRRFASATGAMMSGDGAQAHRQGLAAAATMIGALALARAVDDPALSDEILMAARQSLLAQADL